MVERSAHQQIRLPSLLWPARRATQRSVKYIRWLRPSGFEADGARRMDHPGGEEHGEEGFPHDGLRGL